MTSKRFRVSIIYFVVVVLTLLFRVASALDIYSVLGIENADAFWTCIVQIVIFGAVPFVSYMIFVAGKEDRLLPYFPVKKRKKQDDDAEAVVSLQAQEENSTFETNLPQAGNAASLEDVIQDENNASVECVSQSSNIEHESVSANEQAACYAVNSEYVREQITPEQTSKDVEIPCAKSNLQKAKVAFASFSHDFGFKKLSLKNFLMSVVLGVCMIIIGTAVSMLWQTILSLMGYTASSSHTHYDDVGTLFLQILLVAVLPGFFEEFTHRGMLYAGYKDSGWKFVVLSALFFGLMHQNIRQTGYTFVDGLSMALAMYYTGSIWPGIMMHFINNFWSVFVGYVSDVGGAFSFIITVDNWLFSTIGGLVVCVALVVLAVVFASLIFVVMRKDAVNKGRIPNRPFAKSQAYPIHRDLMFWLTVAVGVAATVFSLVWGLIR